MGVVAVVGRAQGMVLKDLEDVNRVQKRGNHVNNPGSFLLPAGGPKPGYSHGF